MNRRTSLYEFVLLTETDDASANYGILDDVAVWVSLNYTTQRTGLSVDGNRATILLRLAGGDEAATALAADISNWFHRPTEVFTGRGHARREVV